MRFLCRWAPVRSQLSWTLPCPLPGMCHWSTLQLQDVNRAKHVESKKTAIKFQNLFSGSDSTYSRTWKLCDRRRWRLHTWSSRPCVSCKPKSTNGDEPPKGKRHLVWPAGDWRVGKFVDLQYLERTDNEKLQPEVWTTSRSNFSAVGNFTTNCFGFSPVTNVAQRGNDLLVIAFKTNLLPNWALAVRGVVFEIVFFTFIACSQMKTNPFKYKDHQTMETHFKL